MVTPQGGSSGRLEGGGRPEGRGVSIGLLVLLWWLWSTLRASVVGRRTLVIGGKKSSTHRFSIWREEIQNRNRLLDFGGKKFKIEIDSSIWREEIQNGLLDLAGNPRFSSFGRIEYYFHPPPCCENDPTNVIDSTTTTTTIISGGPPLQKRLLLCFSSFTEQRRRRS